jgi:hypothetical protein
MNKLFKLMLIALAGTIFINVLDVEGAAAKRERGSDYASDDGSSEDEERTEENAYKRGFTQGAYLDKEIKALRSAAAQRYYALATPALQDFMRKLIDGYHDEETRDNALHGLFDSPYHLIILKEMIHHHRDRTILFAQEANLSGITPIQKAEALRLDDAVDLLRSLIL